MRSRRWLCANRGVRGTDHFVDQGVDECVNELACALGRAGGNPARGLKIRLRSFEVDRDARFGSFVDGL